MNSFNFKDHELNVSEVHHDLPPRSLCERVIRFEKGASIAENEALVAYSDVKTGRSPKDKRALKHPESEKNIWRGNVSIPCDEDHGVDYTDPSITQNMRGAYPKKLAGLFCNNFTIYEAGVSAEIKAAGPAQ